MGYHSSYSSSYSSEGKSISLGELIEMFKGIDYFKVAIVASKLVSCIIDLYYNVYNLVNK